MDKIRKKSNCDPQKSGSQLLSGTPERTLTSDLPLRSMAYHARPILVVGDLGLWHGRRMGYKEIPSGNIRDCLYSERDMDYSTWYVDKNGDFRCDAIHHDGTNHYLYRAYKDSVSDTQIENLKEKLYRGIATRADITRVTRRLGDEIAHVYGFPIPRRRVPVQER